MHNNQAITKSPSLWISLTVAVLYLFLTSLYQLVSLPGKIAISIYTLGEFALGLFGLSILLSVVMLFARKHHPYSYLPLLINALTFSLLYGAWFVVSPTQTRAINDDRSRFYSHTAVELPREVHNVQEFDNTHDSVFGDGDAELSFQLDKENLQQWISGSSLQWRQGVYKKDGKTLNEFTDNGTLIFKDSSEIEYVVIDRTPPNLKRSPSDISDSTTIFVNQTEGWVLVKDYDL
jgi:hypothetical protein